MPNLQSTLFAPFVPFAVDTRSLLIFCDAAEFAENKKFLQLNAKTLFFREFMLCECFTEKSNISHDKAPFSRLSQLSKLVTPCQ